MAGRVPVLVELEVELAILVFPVRAHEERLIEIGNAYALEPVAKQPVRFVELLRRFHFIGEEELGDLVGLAGKVQAVGHALAIQVAVGLIIGFLEGWSIGDAVYFTFITGLTIGYGDIVPRQGFARALSVAIGVSGLFLTGVIAGIAVYAMNAAIDSRDSR